MVSLFWLKGIMHEFEKKRYSFHYKLQGFVDT